MKYYVKIGLIMSVYLDPNLTSGGHDAVGGVVPHKQHEKSVPRLRWIPVWPSNKAINVSLGCRHFINSVGIIIMGCSPILSEVSTVNMLLEVGKYFAYYVGYQFGIGP
jgi:hypothetical protein